MAVHNRHLTDEELLQAADHELPARQQVHVDDHVAWCDECRTRYRMLGETLRQSTRLYRESAARVNVGAIQRDGRRDHVDVHLQRDSRHSVSGRSSGEGMRSVPGVRWAAIAAAVVLGMVLLRLPRPAWMAPPQEQPAGASALPIADLTPGATWELSLDELCDARPREQGQVPVAVRQRVVRDYHVEGVSPDDYELDYLITPELGGAPDARNLWPQWYTTGLWNARVKDQLEQALPRMVCSKQVALATAQRDIARDWIGAYKKYFRTDAPIGMQVSLEREEDDDPGDLRFPVWRSRGGPAPRLISFSSAR